MFGRIKRKKQLITSFFLTVSLIPLSSVNASECTDTYKVINVRKNDHLSVRAGPGSEHNTVAWLHHEESCIRKSEECSGKWCKIEFGSIKGWVHTYYLELNKNK